MAKVRQSGLSFDSTQEMATLTSRMAEVTERALRAGKQVMTRVEVEME